MFKKATRQRARLRMAIDGPAGAGKSKTSLRFAFALGRKIAAIDTERGSLSLYHGERYDGNVFDFDVVELTSYSPTEYTRCIEAAGRQGYDVLIIDSLSHAWTGKDGALELKDKQGGNSFAAWKNITPMHNAMVEAILTSPCHVIATMRSKTEYVLETNDRGKQEPRRVGVSPIQRAGMEYEFTVYCSMDWSHILTVQKSRCPAIDGLTAVKPGADFMEPLIRWLETGDASPSGHRLRLADDATVAEIAGLAAETGYGLDRVRKDVLRRYSVHEVGDLKQEQAEEYLGRLRRAARPMAAADPSVAAPPANGNGANGHAHVPAAAPASPTPESAPAAEAALPAGPPAAAPAEPLISDDQADALNAILRALSEQGLTREQWQDVLRKRGVSRAADLTRSQADELITKMRARVTVRQLEEGLDAADADDPGAAELRESTRAAASAQSGDAAPSFRG